MVNDTEIKNFLELISTHLPDMLWAKDIDGKYLFANNFHVFINLSLSADGDKHVLYNKFSSFLNII